MDPLDDFAARQRRVTPPPGSLAGLERAVTARLAAPRPRRTGRVALVFAGAAAVLLLILGRRDGVPTPPPPAFVESVVILDGHTCIWLEPVEAPR